MRRKKKVSQILAKMQQRAKNVASFDAKFDGGGGVNVHSMNQQNARLEAAVAELNGLLPLAIAVQAKIKDEERKTADLGERLLSAVGVRFGKDSQEYAQAGGIRKRDRRRPRRGKVVAPASVAKVA